jgi:hypothetical protein
MIRTYAGPTQTIGTTMAPTMYTAPQQTTSIVQAPVQQSPAPMGAMYTQPMMYGTMPMQYGTMGMGYPTMSAPVANNKFPAPADDAISA